MKQAPNGRSRKIVMLVKAQEINGIFYPVGTRLMVRVTKELTGVEEYNGEWSRKHKTKFNLRDLRF